MATDGRASPRQLTIDDMPVDKAMVELMLAHIMRMPQLFMAARSLIGPVHFRPEEVSYKIVWGCALEHYARHNAYPSREIIAAMVLAYLRNDQFSPGAADDGVSLVEWIFSPRWDNDLNLDVGYAAMQRFLRERIVEDDLKKAVNVAANGRAVPDLFGLINRATNAITQINSLQSVADAPIMPDTFERPPIVVMPTRIRAIDNHMDGGAQAKETNVLLAPSGVGKTMTAVDILCGRAEQQYELEIANPGSGKLCVYCTYEESHDLIVPRFWARAAQIHITDARRMRSMAEMSTRGNLKEYEQQRFRTQIDRGDQVPGERERYEAAKPMVNTLIKIGDFCGTREPGRPSRGHGGIGEIAQYLDVLTNQTQRGIDTLIVDWAGMAVKRHLRHLGKDEPSAVSKALSEFVDELFGSVVGRFGCVGWVMHQIAGEYNNKSPAFKFHHSHGEWCKSFAVNAWYAFTLSTKSGSHCVLRCTKSRRSEGTDRETVCRIDGAFGRLLTDETHTIDSITGRIESRSDVRRFVETPQQTVSDLD